MAGFCVWFTGLPASGKTTHANLLAQSLKRHACPAEILDGDQLRQTISRDLGFSKKDRDIHVQRVGALAAQQVKAGKVVICALVSPYRAAREQCRALIGPDRFIEIFVQAPLSECERRDPKGFYAKARRGELKQFSGIDDPYEPPLTPDLVLDTGAHSIQENAGMIEQYLIQKGFFK
jgi:sulfate adenylyltransferase